MTYYGGCVERDDIDKYEELGNLVQTVISSLGRDEQINQKQAKGGRSCTFPKAIWGVLFYRWSGVDVDTDSF